MGLDRSTVGKWRRRFVERRVGGCMTSHAPGLHARLTTPALKP